MQTTKAGRIAPGASLRNIRSLSTLPRRSSRMTMPPAARGSQPQQATEPLGIDQAAEKWGWDKVDPARRPDFSADKQVQELPVAAVRRPLGRVRINNQEKVEVLKKSIQEIGLLEPIDVLEVEGVFYGFSGCHRFQAHQELGKETILCRVRKATPQVLKYHMM